VKGLFLKIELEIDPRYASAVMLVSGGYPESYEKGKVITGLKKIKNTEDLFICHAGTKNKNDQVITNGGRVLAVTAFDDNFQDALQTAYKNIENINFDKKYFRRDLGQDLV